jgi:hypothetical protein
VRHFLTAKILAKHVTVVQAINDPHFAVLVLEAPLM